MVVFGLLWHDFAEGSVRVPFPGEKVDQRFVMDLGLEDVDDVWGYEVAIDSFSLDGVLLQVVLLEALEQLGHLQLQEVERLALADHKLRFAMVILLLIGNPCPINTLQILGNRHKFYFLLANHVDGQEVGVILGEGGHLRAHDFLVVEDQPLRQEGEPVHSLASGVEVQRCPYFVKPSVLEEVGPQQNLRH